ncbi:unnamed protein product [Larinioides sclopetarius]|uniref:ABC-type xenobiotic transporter n=1 Tax=Larinioides sclopetarius TaxID=280406 RepID=A0AAV1ZBV6_9ARAC
MVFLFTYDVSKSSKESENEEKRKASIWQLFHYCKKWDIFLLIIGSFCAFVNGAGIPVLAVVFGSMTNTILQESVRKIPVPNENNAMFINQDYEIQTAGNVTNNNFEETMTTFALYLSYIGITVFLTSMIQVISWTTVGERQFSAMRQEFFYQILRHEISWFDNQQSGELTTRLNDDLQRIREGIGEKIGIIIQYSSTFIAGFLVGFVKGWQLTLVILSVTPLIALTTAIFGKITSSSAVREQKKYAIAGGIAEEALSSIRTVTMFNGQDREIKRSMRDNYKIVGEGLYGGVIWPGFLQNFVSSKVPEDWTTAGALWAAYPLVYNGCPSLEFRMIFLFSRRFLKIVEMFLGKYKSVLAEGLQITFRKIVIASLSIGLSFLVLFSSYGLAFWYGTELVSVEKITPGDVFTILFAVMIGASSLGHAMPNLALIATAKGAATSIFDIIKALPSIDPYSKNGIQPENFSPHIEFCNVHFSYPTRKSVQVLKNFSLLIKEGQTVALCGHSGSGKSTLVNLILRFYDPIKGNVNLGDYDLKTLNVKWLRSQIGIVSQEPILFSGNIAENIEYGHEGVSFPDIVAAAKMANAHGFITKLPQGYDTSVGEKGVQLSGGQKQRIAIARALVRDPRILLLDEATSALDAESEAIVQEALDKAQVGRTTIVIAHRLSTIKKADVICAMENGEIREQGTHQELMAKRGLYYQLVTNQVFIDKNGPCLLEKARLSDAGTFQNLKRKKSSLHNPLKHRLSSLEEDLQEENIKPASGLQIIKENKQEWKEIVVGFLASVLAGVIMPSFAMLYGEIFHTLSLTGDDMKNSAFFWSMMFLVLAGLAAVGHFIRFLGFSLSNENMATRMRYETFTNILRQDITWFEDQRHNSGKLASRLSNDIPLMQSAAGFRIALVITSFVSIFTSITIAFIIGWKLALVLFIAVPIILASGAVQMKMSKANQKRDADLMATASEIASEAIENIKTVQALTLETRFYERYVSNLLGPITNNKKKVRYYSLAYAFSQAIMFFIYAASFRMGAYLLSQNEMEAVDIYRVFFVMAFSSKTASEWIAFLPDYSKAKLSAGIVFHFKSLVPTIDCYSKGGICPEIRGKIDFIDVKFRYPSRRNVQVLQGFSLSVNPGQTVAFVGASGCGKSTLIALLERFYDPDQGQILIDGFDIKAMNLKHLRSQMALVSQEPVLFNCTIKENIIYGMEDKISNSDIEDIAEIANIHDFIKKLPQGYDTIVGEKGTQLSGGQKQRIAIARALIRRPKILLLDEATSALDTESEKAVQDALDQAKQGRTCIVIAHRLSTIQNADCIAVIDGGKIVEKGTHQELVNNKGIYYNLIKRQYK